MGPLAAGSGACMEDAARTDGERTVSPLAQALDPAEPLQALATLGGVRRALTPQRKERFRFAGTWLHAAGGQAWFSSAMIARLSRRRDVRSAITRRKKDQPYSVLAGTAPAYVSLFGVDPDHGGETYLIWKGADEPAIATYIDEDHLLFHDLAAYLTFLTTGSGRQASRR